MTVIPTCFRETLVALSAKDDVRCSNLITDGADTLGIRVLNLNVTSLAIDNVWEVANPSEKYTLQNDVEFEVANNPKMKTLDLTGIHTMVDTSLVITENEVLETILLGKLTDVINKKTKDNQISIYNNPALTTIDMYQVKTLSYFSFDLCPNVESLSLAALTEAENIVVGIADLKPPKIPVGRMRRRATAGPGTQKSRLTTLNLASLKKVKQNIKIEGHPFLNQILMDNLEEVVDLSLGALVLDAFELPALSMVHGELDIQETQAEVLQFSALTSAGNVVIQLNEKLGELQFPRLRTVNGDVEINDNPDLLNLDISGLEQTYGDLLLQNLEKLATCNFASLKMVGPEAKGGDNYQSLFIKNTALERIDLAVIERVGLIDIQFNDALTDFVIGPKLVKLTNKLFVHQNLNLRGVEMQAQSRGLLYGVVMNDEINILANDNLETVTLNNVNTIQGNMTFLDNPNLRTITSNLQAVVGPGSYVVVEENPKVQEIKLLYLQRVEGENGDIQTDLKSPVCIENSVPAANFEGISKCAGYGPNGPAELCPEGVTGAGVFGIIVAVFAGLAVAGGAGYWWGKRVGAGARNGYKSVN